MNSSPSPQTTAGNRITFSQPLQQLPNGTINITGGHPGSGPTIISTSQLPNTTTIKTITSTGAAHPTLPQQVQLQHHQVLQAGPQQVQSVQTATQQHNAQTGNQQMINSMIPASVVVGMRPQGVQQQQQKNVQANALGRVVIGNPHMTRPQSPAITLSALTPGQTPALILKTENGFQLLRVGTASSSPVAQTIGNNTPNPTQIRLQTVPAASMTVTSSAPNNIVVNSIAATNAPSHVYTTQSNISLQQPISSATLNSMQHQQHMQVTQQSQQQQLLQTTQHLHVQPQITQIQTISAPQPQQQMQQQLQTQQQVVHQQLNAVVASMNNNNNNNNNTTTTTTAATTPTTTAQGNTKEKCRKFLANLIDLSTREPKPVEKNVRNLIQELVNANVEPEEFCDRLERLLNASPQPCLIGFLKKSLPLLRQALHTKELVIEGIRPPPQHVVGMSALQHTLPKIQAQIRPISQNQTTTIGQTQVRMITPAGVPRPIGHTTITSKPPIKPMGGIRIQAPNTEARLVAPQIRMQMPQPLQTQLQPGQITTIRTPMSSAGTIQRPATVQIRAGKGKHTGIAHVKAGQTQIKALPSTANVVTSSQPPLLTAISNNASSTMSSPSSILSTINSVATNSMSGSMLPTPSLPTVQLPPAALSTAAAAAVAADNIKSDLLRPHEVKIEKGSSIHSTVNKTTIKPASASTSKASSKKKKDQQDKDKDDKAAQSGSAAAAASSSFFQQPSISMSSSLYGDDDINDVAAMGGVNLAEESQRILGCTENIGTQIRSCKDEVFLHLPALQARIRTAMAERGLEEPSQDVAVLISHACQERLKNIVEKLAVIAEHRIDVIKLDPRYEVTRDVRGQIKFLEELDKAEQKRHEEMEREMLLRAAKSRSKIEDPEQAKMKARAKEMQRAEMEELRQRDANMTALQAIGPRKKLKLDGDASGSGIGSGAGGALGASGAAPVPLRPRIKRINLRDMIFFMEQERELCRSELLYKAYLK